MGIKLFSSSSLERDNPTNLSSNINPQMDNWSLLKCWESKFSTYVVIEIKYHNCINYEGRKILVFDCNSFRDLVDKNNNLIDPHFSEDKRYLHPIARFEPTEEGWKNAVKYVCYLSGIEFEITE